MGARAKIMKRTPLKRRTPLRGHTPLKARKPMNRISKNKVAEKRIEDELRAKLLEEHCGLCMECHLPPDFRGLSLHHGIFKSQGGRSEPGNVALICGKCHSRFHRIIEK